MDGLLGFSDFPLTLVSWSAGLGVVLTLGWLAWGLLALARGAAPPAGWAVGVAMLFLGSVQAVGLAIVSEYVRRMFHEVKGRPTYIVREGPAAVPRVEVLPDLRRAA
jgi:hypothetical protein